MSLVRSLNRCTPTRSIEKPGLGPRGNSGGLTPCSLVAMVGWRLFNDNNGGLTPWSLIIDLWWVHLFMWKNNVWNDLLIILMYNYIVDKYVRFWKTQAINVSEFWRNMIVSAVEPTGVALYSVSWLKLLISTIFDVMFNYQHCYLYNSMLMQ